MNAVLFRDLLMNMLLGLTALVMLVLPTINPPAAANTESISPPGNMVVAISWPEGGTDVDLWVSGPSEKKAVGYSNRGGQLFNLLRDDLGTTGDSMPFNYENAYSRGLTAGEYIVNIHGYSLSAETTVNVEIRLGGSVERMKLLLETSLTLRQGQERTVVRFRLDAKGDVVPGSMSQVFSPLRSAKK